MSTVVDFDEDTLMRAVALVAEASAKKTGRHVEWCKRRILEALDFVREHDRTHQDYFVHMALAMPVMQAAKDLGGIVDEHKVH